MPTPSLAAAVRAALEQQTTTVSESLKAVAFFKEIEQHGKFADMNTLLNQVYGVSNSAVRQLDRNTLAVA